MPDAPGPHPMKRIWSFATGNNLVPLVLIGLLAFFAYQRYARVIESKGENKPGPVVSAPSPKYVERIIEKHYYTEVVPGVKEQILPKAELEKERPGSVSPAVKADNNADVVARIEVPPARGPTQVDAIRHKDRLPDNSILLRYTMDTRKLPASRFDFKKEWRFGAYYGPVGSNIAEVNVTSLPVRVFGYDAALQGRVGMERDGGRFNGQLLVGVEY